MEGPETRTRPGSPSWEFDLQIAVDMLQETVLQYHHSQRSILNSLGELAGQVSIAEARYMMRTQRLPSTILEMGETQVSSHTFPDILVVSKLSSRLQLSAGLLAG